MGNAESIEAAASASGPRRPPNKLSKPRVGNLGSSSSNMLAMTSNPQSSANLPTKFSNSYLVGPAAAAAGESLPRVQSSSALDAADRNEDPTPETRSKRFSGVFRSKSAISEADLKRRSLVSQASNGSLGIGRAKTLPYASHAAVAPSWQESGLSLERRRSLQPEANLLEPLHAHDSTEPIELEASPARHDSKTPPPDTVTESTWKSSHPQPGTSSAPISRNASDISLYIPVRRRSVIQTPGVATRAQAHPPMPLSAKSSFRQSLPVPERETEEETSVDELRHYSMPPPPRLADPMTPMKRVTTPCEADYQQLGGIKFGSLRIMNGSPARSPAPEPKHKNLAKLGIVSNQGLDVVDSRNGVKIVYPKPTTRVVSPIVETFAKSDMDSKFEVSPLSPRPQEPQDYFAGATITQAESPPSPVDDFQATSKRTEHEDELFDDEASYPEVESSEDQNTNSSESRLHQDDARVVVTVRRSDSGFASLDTDTHGRQPLAKADSGYSSLISVKGEERKLSTSSRGEDQCISNSSSLDDTPFNSSSPEHSSERSIHAPTHEPPPIPGETPQVTEKVSAPSTSAPKTNKLRKSQPDLRALAQKRRKSAEAAITRSNSDKDIYHDASRVPVVNASKPHKFSRMLAARGKKDLPIGYQSHEIVDVIPSVPVDVEAKLHERNRRFPTASRRLTLRDQPSRHSLMTIMSVGSGEYVPVEGALPEETIDESAEVGVLSVVPDLTTLPESEPVEQQSLPEVQPSASDQHDLAPLETPIAAPKASRRRRSFQAVSGSIAHIMPTKMFASRKSLPAMKNSAESDLDLDLNDDGFDEMTDDDFRAASMDDIRHSVGRSAFDQALIAMSEEPPLHEPRNVHQVTRGGRSLKYYAPRHPLTTNRPVPKTLGSLTEGVSTQSMEPMQNGRAPPPVSMRTRGSQRSRNRRPAHTRAHSAMPDMHHPARPGNAAVEGLAQLSMRDLSSPNHSGQNVARGRGRRSSGQTPKYRTWASDLQRQASSPASTATKHSQGPQHSGGAWQAGPMMAGERGQDSPFRVLHSYNSPAYRGAPIWG